MTATAMTAMTARARARASSRATARVVRAVRTSASEGARTMTRRTRTRAMTTRSVTSETETVAETVAETVFASRERAKTTALGAVGALTWATNAEAANAATNALGQLSGLDPEGAKAASAVLGPLFAVSTILFIVRIVMTWYPSVPYTKLPWVVAYAPTEPLLKPTRAMIPPVGGVDVSPIVWVMTISFMNEILLGKQGLLVLLSNKQLGG